MEVARGRTDIARIAVAANVIEHPGDDPIIAFVDPGPIVPDFRFRAGMHPDKPDHGAKGSVRELICGEGRRRTRIFWLQKSAIVSHLGCECPTSFILNFVSHEFMFLVMPLPSFACTAPEYLDVGGLGPGHQGSLSWTHF